ncbi:MAG: copper resistance protein CopC/CopD [Rhodospirillaceae bacterium]|nr:copper resistance protein CopC/CopD [Rhodospirillaceae bacterium]
MRLLAALLLLIGAALQAAPVSAHAVLQSTEPADRQVLSAAPRAVLLTFNEPVTPIAVQILDGGGRIVTREARQVDATLAITLPPELADGIYIASWRATSLDSHPISGSLMFAIGAPPAAWIEPQADADQDWRTAFVLVRATLSIALILAAGGALSLAFVRPSPALHPLLARFAWAGIGLSIVVVGVQGGLLRGGQVTDLLFLSTWQIGASTTRGWSATVAILGLAVLLLGLKRSGRSLMLAGAVVAVSSVAFTGHTGTASPRWLSSPLLALHAVLAAFWLGSLMPLLDGLEKRKETKQLVARFSRLATFAVPILIFCGVGLVFRHVASWDDLTGSRYGTVLLVKVVLVAGLIAMAAVNKWILTPRLPRSSAGLTTMIRAEFGLGLVVLSVTALLTQTPPPASEHAHVLDPAHMHGMAARMESAGHIAEIEITPALAGRNLIVVRLDLAEVPKEVAIELSNPAAGIEPIRRPMTNDNGAYVLEGPELAVPGTWTIRLDVLVTDFDKASFETEIPVR